MAVAHIEIEKDPECIGECPQCGALWFCREIKPGVITCPCGHREHFDPDEQSGPIHHPEAMPRPIGGRAPLD